MVYAYFQVTHEVKSTSVTTPDLIPDMQFPDMRFNPLDKSLVDYFDVANVKTNFEKNKSQINF